MYLAEAFQLGGRSVAVAIHRNPNFIDKMVVFNTEGNQ
jgi:hypothetical protein